MSETLNYFIDGISNTYDETVDFWTSGHAINDTVNAVEFTIENPTLMKDTAMKNINASLDELGTAANHDKNRVILLAAAGAALYFFLTKRKK